ncbi:ClpP/crotonase-like domain-containing protein [Phakopsora pachyrhizi]|uniref:Probable enoyl-CoA hydratase, mitochondrial n=1 Tax=Phakopsora pachyrhizi TaxID=170000 RepID=A0AAV0BAH2_PHAPC|nr:ClpP/crotonase-like domain-containing protein [Phakopsora pachyrhizi]CAH7677205.1 ClpP/crotonase-like domain-containing protein [Phakopsora pachyrhizi]CAH7684225.1 ClpP/crotonase-like domain-containing protein [Phakopsora pachyrhizi]
MLGLRTVGWIFRSTPTVCQRIQGTTQRKYSSVNIPMDHKYIIHSKPAPLVSLIQLNRPKALNALSSELFRELNQTLRAIDESHTLPDSSKCIILTGSNKAFAAGADIVEMKDRSLANVYGSDFLADWTETIQTIKVPIIAAVSGFALGGGLELAMMCDIMLASSDAKFGMPEINLGVIPGAGGTQRLIRSVGKSKAMELILSGQHFSAQEAYEWGLISRVVEGGQEELLKESIELAKTIASKPKLAAQAAKESINSAYELQLKQGLAFEKRLFHLLFGTNDQKEGMNAFAERRKPDFKDS